ncbi:MAG TPA: ATP-binding protein, partial [Gemmatimonadaceae bacterium]
TDILTFVRSERGTIEYRIVEMSVHDAVREVVEMLQGAVEERRLTFAYHHSHENASIRADVGRVRQILLNLVANAIKYGAVVGGCITLETTATHDTVAIHVADNGPGIAAGKLDVIFDAFAQLPSGLNERRGGVGLGLAISRELARAMNGELTVASALGAGARFTLTLPRVRQM